MNSNSLKLNQEKTEILIIGTDAQRLAIMSKLGNLSSQVKPTIKNLGVILDPDLNFGKHISNVTKIAFYHLRNIARVRPFLSLDDAKKLTHAFVLSRLDYCNALYTGLPKKTVERLQLIQNAAARILTNTRKRDHITPVLASLHWIPVKFRIDFKALLLVFKALNGLAPPYLSDCLDKYVPGRALRSLDAGLLTDLDVNGKKYGEAAFASYAPTIWNQLPLKIRHATSIDGFKTQLKTHFYNLAFN